MWRFNIDKLSRIRTWEWYLKAWVPVAYYTNDELSHFESSSEKQLKDRERISMETNKRAQYSFLLIMITQSSYVNNHLISALHSVQFTFMD